MTQSGVANVRLGIINAIRRCSIWTRVTQKLNTDVGFLDTVEIAYFLLLI